MILATRYWRQCIQGRQPLSEQPRHKTADVLLSKEALKKSCLSARWTLLNPQSKLCPTKARLLSFPVSLSKQERNPLVIPLLSHLHFYESVQSTSMRKALGHNTSISAHQRRYQIKNSNTTVPILADKVQINNFDDSCWCASFWRLCTSITRRTQCFDTQYSPSH